MTESIAVFGISVRPHHLCSVRATDVCDVLSSVVVPEGQRDWPPPWFFKGGDGDAAKDERGMRSRESDRAELTSFQTFAPKIPRVRIRATLCGPYWLGLTTLFGS
jgi:hypothetical protein